MSSTNDEVEVEVEVNRMFIGAGCNRIVNNVSWGACDLVAFGAQNGVAIFCPKSAQILTTLPGHKAVVNCTHWLPSTKFAFKAKHLEQHYLLSGDAEGVIILWELSLSNNKWRHVLQLPHSHMKGVTCISGIMVSETDAIFASTSSDRVLKVWDVVFPTTAGGSCKLSCIESLYVGSKPMFALSLAELPGSTDRLVLAMGGLDKIIKLYCGERTGKFVRACELKGHTDWIQSLDFSLLMCTNGEANSIMLVSSAKDKGIRIWKMVLRGSVENSQGTYRKEEISLSSYIEGPVLVAGSNSYQISLESLLIGHEDWVSSVEWHPPLAEGNSYHQPECILSASMDMTMMIWKPERKLGIWMNVVTVRKFSHCALGFDGGHWSPDGLSILGHGYGGSFHLWKNVGIDIDNWKPQTVPSGHFAAVTDIAWARSGECMLSVSHDPAESQAVAEIMLWEVGSWKALGRLQSHNFTVTQMEFSHDDNLLLSVSRDHHLSIFKIHRTGTSEISHELIARQEGHKSKIWTCSWNPFGHEFATGSSDKTVKIWSVFEKEESSSVKLILALPPMNSSVIALSWVGLDREKNHGFLAVGMENGLIELWSLNIKRNKEASVDASLVVRLDPLMCHVLAVNCLAWRNSEKSQSCNSLQLASCGADHCVRVFEVKV